MVAILEKSENVDFHPIVDFIEASPLRYALTVKPTVYVSHIRQFCSTAKIETMEEGTKILATVDGILRTVTESSLNLKLQDKEGIRFNEFSSNIATALVCLATLLSTALICLDGLVKIVNNKGEGSCIPTEPHHTPSSKAHPTSHTTHSSPTLPPVTTASIPTVTPFETTPIRQYTRRARIAQSSALPPIADEPTSPLRDVSEGEAAPERVSDDTEEMATVLTSMDAATVLASGVAEVPTGSGSIPTVSPPANEVPTGSDVFPTASLILATATVVTPYTRRKGKETLLEEEMERDSQRMNEQIAQDAEIARIHAEEELQSMIDGLDRSNETVAKYLQEYQQFASELPLERRIELISDLTKYQDNYAKVHKFQTQQRKPWSKKQKRDYYMAVIRSNLGWKVKDFRGMTFEEIEAKFTTVWKQIKDFIPIGSKEEEERFKRRGIRFEQESVKKLKTSESVPEEVKSPDEVPKEKVKEMMQLVPIEEVYVEALQVKHPIIDWKVHTEGQRSFWKITRLGGSSASYQFFVDMLKHLDTEDLNQLWALVKESLSNRLPTIEWKLYDTCRVHHVTAKDKEIFMLVEKDYPLRKGLAIVMICYKLQGRIVGNKMHKAFLLLVIEFPLPEEVPTAGEESSHCQKKREAVAVKIALLPKSKRNCLSKSDDSYAKIINHLDVPFHHHPPKLILTRLEHRTCYLTVTGIKDTFDLRAKTILCRSYKGEPSQVAIEKRFGGNKETKKVKKTLLKQQYENFIGLSSESLDQIHDRLQKLISQLEILKESLSQEDII
uniref:Uncharacterized protein n=1 Tax=Tanacetum cinerariifolium TaxID=118510 RepID=A0A6L2J1L8_TANCI|nr:hypothetical protein [Tanacetum cinerariifolium]